jgi:hypothetical protein
MLATLFLTLGVTLLATYALAEPAIFESEYQVSPVVQAYFAATGHTTAANIINRADFVTLTAGALNRSLTTAGGGFASLLSGLAIHSELAVFSNTTIPTNYPPGGAYIGNLFGATQVGLIAAQNLLPNEPGQVHVNKLFGGQMLEVSLDRAVAWSAALINAPVYLYLDTVASPGSNLFYVSTTSSGTSIGTLINVVVKATQGVLGDFGVRVLINLAPAIVN